MKSALVCIDGPNVWASCRNLGINIDYLTLKSWLGDRYDHFDIRYYTSFHKEDDGFIANKRLTDFLEYNGITVIQREARLISRGSAEALVKGNLDVEIAVDITEIGARYTDIILFSGDGDFTYPLELSRRKGKAITVISSIGNEADGKNVVSDSIRRVAHKFIDMAAELSKLQWIKKQNTNEKKSE